MKRPQSVEMGKSFLLRAALLAVAVAGLVAPVRAADRPFLMGTSTFSDFFQFTYENLSDKDLVAVHVDNYLGVPWAAFQTNAAPPAAWVNRWTSIASGAATSGKKIYLAVGFFSGDRRTLADAVNPDGSTTAGWAPKDSDGCYPFASDANASLYKQAYINYAKWAINKVHPQYFSPAIEISIALQHCPAEKTALVQWYGDVHQALKAAYPDLIVFPTFQAETMYGLADAGAWCGGTKTDASLAACFQTRLNEAVAIPADRIAFSFYPSLWNYPPTAPDTYTSGAVPYEDMFSRVKATTARPIWISETGWPAVQISTSYYHASPASACAASPIVPSPIIASESNMAAHMTNLLAQAQSKSFEAVVWWSNRDLFDATVAAQCPCSGANATCTDAEQLYQTGGGGAPGDFIEYEFRIFANMGLRYNDGSPRNAVYSIWHGYQSEPLSLTGVSATTNDDVHIYPNPFRPALGQVAVHITHTTPGGRVRIYTLAGEKVRELTADDAGDTAWDGTNGAGKNVASGVYFVLVEGNGDKKTLKVAVER